MWVTFLRYLEKMCVRNKHKRSSLICFFLKFCDVPVPAFSHILIKYKTHKPLQYASDSQQYIKAMLPMQANIPSLER